ncbi:MAG: hypothetical protein MUE30_06875, partial [Spirosomaceae bacterium]|nr:hypothetical protein [Spirosomataceae bacterium]
MTPEQISHVSDVNAFMTQLGKQTNNLTQPPKSFAVDFAPRWFANKPVKSKNLYGKSKLFGQEKTKNGSSEDKNNFTTIPQTFVLSLAYQDSTDVTFDFTPRPARIAAGFRFSIVRGELKNPTEKIKAYKTGIKALGEAQKAYKALHSQKQIQLQEFGLINSDHVIERVSPALLKTVALEKQIKDLLVSRQGCFWDVAGGKTWDSYFKPVPEIKYSKWALWSTFGYEWVRGKEAEMIEDKSYSNFAVMGMIR